MKPITQSETIALQYLSGYVLQFAAPAQFVGDFIEPLRNTDARPYGYRAAEDNHFLITINILQQSESKGGDTVEPS